MKTNIPNYPRHLCAEVNVEVSACVSGRHPGMCCNSLYVKSREVDLQGFFSFVLGATKTVLLSFENCRNMH